MKKNQFTLIAATFLSGIILGVTAISLFAFTGSGVAPASSPAVSKISVQEANVLFKNYFSSASPSNSVFKGFAINRDELAAMNNLVNENAGLAGIRVYMGNDNTLGKVGILVGISNTGADVPTSIYRSPAVASGPCPTICDAASPITVN